MQDFITIIEYVINLFSMQIPIFGFSFSLSSIIIATFILGLFIRVIVYIFKGDD